MYCTKYYLSTPAEDIDETIECYNWFFKFLGCLCMRIKKQFLFE